MLYTGKNLRELIFPLGGIGSGSIGLAGNGRLVDWEILNRPNKGSLNGYSFFAVKAAWPDGRSVTKVLQGDWTRDLVGQYRQSECFQYYGYGWGPDACTMSGFPHFSEVSFDARFPIAALTFRDDAFPGEVVLTAFNPFIPLNADDSSIPAAFFTVEIRDGAPDVQYTVLLSVQNPFGKSVNQKIEGEPFTAVMMKPSEKTPDDLDYGDLTIAVDVPDGICQTYWYRGTWHDHVTTFWHDLTHDTFADRDYPAPGRNDVASVGAAAMGGDAPRFRFLIAWNAPNCCNYWSPYRDAEGRDITWKNHYATRFVDSRAVCRYALTAWDRLFAATARFRDALHGSTLDPAVIDAVSSTLAVLKSPTVLRLEDGSFYGWEGLHERGGSCEGTCTHVWSYAYALCFLFPNLERSIRDIEFAYDTDINGKMRFRSKLPIGRAKVAGSAYMGDAYACVDGQMATVIKIYRDWKISGNTAWLRENWDNIKRVLEFAWNENNDHEWDRNRDGVLEGRQHYTLDMELFGPSSWLEGMYLAALKAAAEMAEFLGEPEKQAEYTELFKKGYAWTKENLFNGEYFSQKINLEDKSYTEHFDCPNYWNEEKKQLKYQIGDGCVIDQMLGQWHAAICGLGDIFDPAQRRTAAHSLFRHNFKPSLREHTNPWRVYALNDEGGSVLCTYPDGRARPVISIPYGEECWTGCEYAFAGLLVSEGMIDEALQVVRTVRARHNGANRNPFNDFECGSNYARSMSAFALLPLFSGFTYDLPRQSIGFSPVLDGNFRCLWSLGTGWGEYRRDAKGVELILHGGTLQLQSLTPGGIGAVSALYADGEAIPFTQDGDTLSFASVRLQQSLRVCAK
ncbi:MAG: hypothetical protein IKD37_07150 [Clostridia bacterium]|nr:hypothetical protein [Clostridia bacterium]